MNQESGSYTIELTVLILAIFFVFVLFFAVAGDAFEGLYIPSKEPSCYEEAFSKKIEDLRHEKVLREQR